MLTLLRARKVALRRASASASRHTWQRAGDQQARFSALRQHGVSHSYRHTYCNCQAAEPSPQGAIGKASHQSRHSGRRQRGMQHKPVCWLVSGSYCDDLCKGKNHCARCACASFPTWYVAPSPRPINTRAAVSNRPHARAASACGDGKGEG